MNQGKIRKILLLKFVSLKLLILFFVLIVCFLFVLYDRKDSPYVTIIGRVQLADGLGRQSIELANFLKKKCVVKIIPTHKVKTQYLQQLKSLRAKKIDQRTKVIIFEDPLWYVNEGDKVSKYFQKIDKQNSILIAYSMFESTRIPNEWVYLLNSHFDAVIVPDEFLLDVYKNSGVQIPIFNIPLLVDFQQFLYEPIKNDRNPIMRFANLSSGDHRKNHIITIRAFAKALGNVNDAELLINMRFCDSETREAIAQELKTLQCHNIKVTEFCLSNDLYFEMFKSIDCYISLSMGEGFSIQPREAMALGIPVIVTDCTAQSTICRSQLVQVVPASIPEYARYHKNLFNPFKINELGYQFNCCEDDAAAAIRYVYEHYQECLKQSEQARKWAAKYDYSSSEFANAYLTLVAPQRVILSNENKIHDNYIETNSQKLVEKYHRVCSCEAFIQD